MTNLNPRQIHKVFFIGIGGIGISALAKMLKAKGMEVSGVNDEEGKTVDSLRESGINVSLLSKVTFDIPAADLYVYSDAWLYRGPEILEQARATGKPVLSYFEALGEVAKDYKVIAISGTHGKTTTTAMVAEVLVEAGLDPMVIVGSFVKKFGSNFRVGQGKYLVVEADEFNRHMLNFHPYIGAVTNIEADHLDVYKDLEEIKIAFQKFLDQSEHKITSVEYEKYLASVPALRVPGEHNKYNAALALAVADALGVDMSLAQKTLVNFEGTWRRLEKRGESSEGVIIYDDYAHHPTEIRAGIKALREVHKSGKLVVVFQPHLYSRTKALFDDFVDCFLGADQVLLLPIYFAREKDDGSVSSGKLSQVMQDKGYPVQDFPDFHSAEEAVRGLNLLKGDVLVTMGAGEAYKVANKVFGLA